MRRRWFQRHRLCLRTNRKRKDLYNAWRCGGNEGIIARAVKKLYEAKTEIEATSRGDSQVSMSVELLEVYNEKVCDLLAPKSGPDGREMNLKVTSQEVFGNAIVSTTDEDEVMQILALAQSRRCVKATASNSESSRSHMLFTIHFEVTNKDGSIRKGKLNVCDLAGSERLSKSGTNLVGVSTFHHCCGAWHFVVYSVIVSERY